MNPSKVDRTRVRKLTDLPNIGPAAKKDLELLGIRRPEDLLGKCPLEMFYELCDRTDSCHDPCVIDVFMSVTRFMAGEPPRPWWTFTEERKAALKG